MLWPGLWAFIEENRLDRPKSSFVGLCWTGPSITDRRGLKPALVKPENLRLAHSIGFQIRKIFEIFSKNYIL